MRPRRSLLRVLGPALLLLAAGLVLPTHDSYAAVFAHVDGYLSADGRCLMLQQHGGDTLALVGDTAGLVGGDHVRLEGRFVADPGCGVPGFDVTLVQTIWAGDNHRTTYYDHLSGEPFHLWAERSGRLSGGEWRGYENERRAYERERRAYENERHGYDSDLRNLHPERFDRYGNYIYQGPHRRVVFVGKLHETAGGCATLETTHGFFALDGGLGDYQPGDWVRVSGMLYDGDSTAPCGSPTVVISGIRGR
jgi:hypothetical protein